jgi:hypothetical protein
VSVARTRRFVGLLTLLALVAIFVGVTGVELPVPRFGGGAQRPVLNGVREVAANVLLRVGSGAPAGGELGFLAVEPSGNLVVSDTRRHTVMRFDPSGHLLSEWGPTFGTMTLTEPAGVAVQGDTFYVVDRGTPRIFRIDDRGQLLGTISLESLGTYGLNGMAVDPAGNLYVADTGRNRILAFSSIGQPLQSIGRSGSDLGGLTQPMMLAFAPDGSFAVADWENVRIERFDASFEATDAFSTGANPWGVAVDQAGRIYAPDDVHRRVVVYTPQGASLGELAQMDVAPRHVALARIDRPSLYVLGNTAIARVDFENTAPPAQGGESIDLVSVLVLALLVAFVVFALLSRRRRRASIAATLDRPVGLHTENGAQRQDQQARQDQQTFIRDQAERKYQPANDHHQREEEAQSRH